MVSGFSADVVNDLGNRMFRPGRDLLVRVAVVRQGNQCIRQSPCAATRPSALVHVNMKPECMPSARRQQSPCDEAVEIACRKSNEDPKSPRNQNCRKLLHRNSFRDSSLVFETLFD